MSPLEYEIARLRAWWFLSLDCVRPFWTDLWVPMPQDVRKDIQSQLSSVGVTAFQEQPGRVNQMISQWISSTASSEHQALIALWADHVYAGYLDRVAEFIWDSIIAMGTGKYRSDCPSWVVDLFSAIRDTTTIYNVALSRRLDDEFNTPESTWDSIWRPAVASNREAVKTTIRLVCSYNILCVAWERLCPKLDHLQLRELHETALKIAQSENIEETQVAFPGSWIFDLRLFIERFGRL
jgi:hypothetical protein